MAVIPNYQAVGVSSPSGRMNVARASGASPVSSALEDVSAVVGRIGEEKYKQATDLATATAKNEYLRSSIDLSNKVQEAPDYNNWQKQYETGAEQAAGAAASKISDPAARQQFQLEAQTEAIRASGVIAERAKQRFKESKVIGLNQSFEENQTALLATDDPEARNSLIVGTNQLYDAAAADGTITPEQARAQKKLFVQGFAKNRADSLIPVARLDALQNGMTVDSEGRTTFAKTGTFTDFISDDDRMKMIKMAQAEHNGEILAQEQAKRAASEIAYKKYTDQIIEDPTKLDIKAVGRDPNLSGEHGETVLRLYQEQIKKLRGGDAEENKGPGFWNTFRAVTAPAGDPSRINDPLQIYNMAGEGRPLSLIGAKELVGLINQRNASEVRGDGEAAASADFYKWAHTQITAGGGVDAEDAYHKWFQAAHAADMRLKNDPKNPRAPDQRYTEGSPDYIGKGIQAIIDKRTMEDETLDKPAPPAPGIISNVIGALFGAATPAPKPIDRSTPQGLRAAVLAGPDKGGITKAQGIEEARKRGWIGPAAAPVALPSAPNVVH